MKAVKSTEAYGFAHYNGSDLA